MRILKRVRISPENARNLCAIGFVLLGSLTPVRAQQSVTAIRFWSQGDVTRVAIEATGDFEYKRDRLVNPDRIFFDLPGTVPALDRKGVNTIPVNDAFLRQIRVAETQRGTTRVVFDMQGTGTEVTTSKLENPVRLMIELRRPGTHPTPETTTASAPLPKATETAKVFHPPSQSALAPVLERPKTLQPALDPPATIVGGQVVKNAVKNDPLARIPAAGVPPPPVPAPESSTVRMARSTSGSAPNLSSITSSSITPSPITPSSSTASMSASSIGQTNLTSSMPESTSQRLGLPAKSRNTKDETMIRALGLKVGRIVIDAGHGGHDTGSSGPGGLKEKDLVLDVAHRLGLLVEQQLAWEVVYTRSDDTFIPLEQRTDIANRKHADLFLSIHANSSSIRTASGIETYYLNFTTSKTALDVAARENATSEKTVFDLQDLLQKIALKDKVDESREFASRIQTSLFTMSTKAPVRTRDRGVRKAPFIVLIGASMPSVLAEIGFISNPRDEVLLKKAEYRQKIAEALLKGVTGYAGTLSHFQVAQSRVQ